MSQFSAPRIIRIFLFTLFLFSVYALFHVAILTYIRTEIGWNLGWEFLVIGSASVLSILISHGRHNLFTKSYYRLSMIWVGLVVLMCLVLLPVWLANTIGERAGLHVPYQFTLIVTAALAIGGFIAAMTPIAKELRVRTYKKHKPVTLVQISDVHIGEIYTPHYLSHLVEMANAAKPDFVVLTGDLFDGGGILYDGMIEPLRKLKAPTVFITGNHEVYEGVSKTTKLVREQGVRVLDDESMVVAGVQLVGVSYPLDLSDDKHDVFRAINRKLDQSKPIVVLRHEPRKLDDAQMIAADLVLCGHTHNGQLWPFNLLVKLFYEFSVGLHHKGKTTVYISPGAGTWGPPFRVGSRAEITVVRLTP